MDVLQHMYRLMSISCKHILQRDCSLSVSPARAIGAVIFELFSNSGPTGIESDDKADLVTANAAAPSPIAPTAALLPKSADDEFLSADYISSQILVQTCPDRQGAASLLRQAD